MSQDVTKHEELWSSFLQRWPIEKLPYITLTEYSTSGNMDSFVNWLESRTADLGSIWGGSSFKFGIYSRKNNEVKISELGRIYDGDYAWYSKYGSTRQEAFERVRELIVTIAQTARKGNFADIENVDFGSVVKWKIAFLYQDKQNPQLLPIYKAEMLEAYLKHKQGASMHELQQEVNALRNEENIFSFGRSVWETANKNLRIATLKPEDAFAYIQSQSDRFFLTEEATEKLAVYATDEEKYLALIRDSNETRLWLESGKWLNNDIQKQLTKIVEYSADNPKRKESGANIPVFLAISPLY